MPQIRVFIIDDSVIFRKFLADVINAIPNVRVAGAASNGQEALDKLPDVKPDFITLDLEMPVLNGLQTLIRLDLNRTGYKVIMISAYTAEGAQATLKALEYGAFDFITKPSFSDREHNIKFLTDKLSTLFSGSTLSDIHTRIQYTPFVQSPKTRFIPEIIAIGVSTGGPNALSTILSSLPHNFPVPILIVQHMPKLFTRSLAESLDRKTSISVIEAQNGTIVKPGTAYIAPGGQQMKIVKCTDNNLVKIELIDDPPEQYCKPSANYLFRSVARIFKERALGVILTGMGSDGILGLKLMKRQGAFIIGQDQTTSIVYGMPREAFKAGVVDIQLPIQDIGPEIINRTKTKSSQ